MATADWRVSWVHLQEGHVRASVLMDPPGGQVVFGWGPGAHEQLDDAIARLGDAVVAAGQLTMLGQFEDVVAPADLQALHPDKECRICQRSLAVVGGAQRGLYWYCADHLVSQ